MHSAETLVVTGRDIGQIVTTVGVDRIMDELIASLTEALACHNDAKTRVVKRDGFAYEHPYPGVLEWMPAMVVGQQALIKAVGYNPTNPGTRGLPTIVSTITLYDVVTGRLIGLMDATLLTALRTGAASAVATRVLARPDCSVVGLVGCGAQAVTQLHAISRGFDIRRVLVYDVNAEASRSFSDRVSFLGLPIQVVARDVLERESDIVCTATSAAAGTGPVVDDSHFQPWVHVNAVGSDLPGKTELSVDFLRRSFVCPDFPEQALAEGEAQQLTAHDLGPSLSDLVKAGDDFTSHRDRSTVFDSTGFAVEDFVVAALFQRYGAEMGIGRRLAIEGLEGDPKNPYADLDLSSDADLTVGLSSKLSR